MPYHRVFVGCHGSASFSLPADLQTARQCSLRSLNLNPKFGGKPHTGAQDNRKRSKKKSLKIPAQLTLRRFSILFFSPACCSAGAAAISSLALASRLARASPRSSLAQPSSQHLPACNKMQQQQNRQTETERRRYQNQKRR